MRSHMKNQEKCRSDGFIIEPAAKPKATEPQPCEHHANPLIPTLLAGFLIKLCSFNMMTMKILNVNWHSRERSLSVWTVSRSNSKVKIKTEDRYQGLCGAFCLFLWGSWFGTQPITYLDVKAWTRRFLASPLAPTDSVTFFQMCHGWRQDPSLGTTQLPEDTLSRCLGVHTQFENAISGEHGSEQNCEDSLLSSLELDSKLVLQSEKQTLPPEAGEMVQW